MNHCPSWLSFAKGGVDAKHNALEESWEKEKVAPASSSCDSFGSVCCNPDLCCGQSIDENELRVRELLPLEGAGV